MAACLLLVSTAIIRALVMKVKPKADGQPLGSSMLKKEVTEFASQLGLGRAEDFDYDDFNPKSAGKSVKHGQNQTGKLHKALKFSCYAASAAEMASIDQCAGGSKHSDRSKQHRTPEAKHPKARAAVVSRPWASGVGSAPGGEFLHTLQAIQKDYLRSILSAISQ